MIKVSEEALLNQQQEIKRVQEIVASKSQRPRSLTDLEVEYECYLRDAAIVYGNPSPELDVIAREFEEKYKAALQVELTKALPLIIDK